MCVCVVRKGGGVGNERDKRRWIAFQPWLLLERPPPPPLVYPSPPRRAPQGEAVLHDLRGFLAAAGLDEDQMDTLEVKGRPGPMGGAGAERQEARTLCSPVFSLFGQRDG